MLAIVPPEDANHCYLVDEKTMYAHSAFGRVNKARAVDALSVVDALDR
jgi:hypothetical protein